MINHTNIEFENVITLLNLLKQTNRKSDSKPIRIAKGYFYLSPKKIKLRWPKR